MITPVSIIKAPEALLAFSNLSSFLPAGSFENAKNKATAAKTAATMS
jgi:hypothetical protein